MAYYSQTYSVPSNTYFGVSVENQAVAADRLKFLDSCHVKTRFVSFEPLLEKINLDQLPTNKIDWAIIGGESGIISRPCNIYWIKKLIDQLKARNIKVFVKQLGFSCFYNDGYRFASKHRLGISGKGNDIKQFPDFLKLREIPELINI